jgi:hypothetical protein
MKRDNMHPLAFACITVSLGITWQNHMTHSFSNNGNRLSEIGACCNVLSTGKLEVNTNVNRRTHGGEWTKLDMVPKKIFSQLLYTSLCARASSENTST